MCRPPCRVPLAGKAGFAVAAGLLAALPVVSARAEPGASPWSTGLHAAVRLLDGGPGATPGTRIAGLEIRLDPHFKTYWRMPGEAGVPPVIDVSASANLKSATWSWPAPVRFEEAGSFSVGYTDGVVLPVDIVAAEPGRPVDLDVAVSYAVCEKICIPVEGRARLTLQAPALSSPAARSIETARALVPPAVALGAGTTPSIAAIQAAADNSALLVDAVLPAQGNADLFVEGPEGWLFGAPVAAGPVSQGRTPWRVPVLSRPSDKEPLAGLALRLTLVAKDAAAETVVTLPSPAPAPG